MKENRVIRKKKTVDQNVKKALQEQAEKNIAMQFGVCGTGLALDTEESKSTAVGRRDLFSLQGASSKQAKPPIGRGARGPQSGRPPLQNKRTPNQTNNFKYSPMDEEEKYSALSNDFNLAGTQIGSTVTNFTSAGATNSKNSTGR